MARATTGGLLITVVGTKWWPLFIEHDLRTFACPRIIVEHACRMLYCARATRARRSSAVPVLYFRVQLRTIGSSLDTHSYDSYSAAERTPARAEATRPTLRVANSLQAHMRHVRAVVTAGRHMTLFERSRLKIRVRRGRCGARGPGAVRRRVACRTARRHPPPHRRSHPDPHVSPVPD